MALDQEKDDGEILDYEDPAEGRRNVISDAFDDHGKNIAEITEPEIAPKVVADKQDPVTDPVTDSVTDPVKTPVTDTKADAQDAEKAPASWTPASREHWAALPEGVRSEIAKREGELQRTLNETVQARQFSQKFQESIQPYEGMFRAQGVDATTGIGNVLQTAAQLQMGTPQQRAQAVAGLIEQFGVDISALDDLLVGTIPAASQATPEVTQLQQQIAQMQQYIQGQQGQQSQARQQQQQTIQTETNDFLEANEFAKDLRGVMADFMDVAERNGQSMTLKDAYSRAMSTRPDIQEIVANRAKTTTNQRAVTNARRAGVSVPQAHGTGGPTAAPTTQREALLDAWDNHS